MKHSLRAERRRVEALAERVRADRASVARSGRLLRERMGARLATPAGLLACFAAGAALAPAATAVLRLSVGGRKLRRLALQSALLYRSFGARGAQTAGPDRAGGRMPS